MNIVANMPHHRQGNALFTQVYVLRSHYVWGGIPQHFPTWEYQFQKTLQGPMLWAKLTSIELKPNSSEKGRRHFLGIVYTEMIR